MIILNSGDTIELESDTDGLYVSTIDATLNPLESTVIKLNASEIEELINILIDKLAEIRNFQN